MIKVLMCGNHPSNKGGMTSVITQIREHDWVKEGIELSFVPTYYPGKKWKTAGCFVYAYLKVLFTFLFKKPDVFYTHMSVRGSFSRTKMLHRLCRFFKIPDVIHLHGSEFAQWYDAETEDKKQSIQTLIRESGAFIVLGNRWENFVRGIAPDANVIQLHNCIRIPETVALWHEDGVRYMYMGVLIPRKGVIDLLKAIKLLADYKKIGKCSFDIAGSGPEEEKLKRFVKENALEEYVRFHGWITGERKTQLLENANVLVLPSYNEGLPVAILEAMSFGLPVISTTVGDISDAVQEGKNGYLITPGDVETLADRISALAKKEIWTVFSAESRQIAKQSFNIEQFYTDLLSVWESALG